MYVVKSFSKSKLENGYTSGQARVTHGNSSQGNNSVGETSCVRVSSDGNEPHTRSEWDGGSRRVMMVWTLSAVEVALNNILGENTGCPLRHSYSQDWKISTHENHGVDKAVL